VQHSATDFPTKFAEWLVHGTKTASWLWARMVAFVAVYFPLMFSALSYDWLQQSLMSISSEASNVSNAFAIASPLWPQLGRKVRNRSTGIPPSMYRTTTVSWSMCASSGIESTDYWIILRFLEPRNNFILDLFAHDVNELFTNCGRQTCPLTVLAFNLMCSVRNGLNSVSSSTIPR